MNRAIRSISSAVIVIAESSYRKNWTSLMPRKAHARRTSSSFTLRPLGHQGGQLVGRRHRVPEAQRVGDDDVVDPRPLRQRHHAHVITAFDVMGQGAAGAVERVGRDGRRRTADEVGASLLRTGKRGGALRLRPDDAGCSPAHVASRARTTSRRGVVVPTPRPGGVDEVADPVVDEPVAGRRPEVDVRRSSASIAADFWQQRVRFAGSNSAKTASKAASISGFS